MMKLSKLSMPSKKKPMDEMESEEMMASDEMEGEEQAPAMEEGMSALAEISDEDLMAELEKRGLMEKMMSSKSEEDEQEAYS